MVLSDHLQKMPGQVLLNWAETPRKSLLALSGTWCGKHEQHDTIDEYNCLKSFFIKNNPDQTFFGPFWNLITSTINQLQTVGWNPG